MSRRSKSARARKRIAEQLRNVPEGTSLSAFRRRRPSRTPTRGENAAKARRRRQIKRGALRPTMEVSWDVAGPVLALQEVARG